MRSFPRLSPFATLTFVLLATAAPGHLEPEAERPASSRRVFGIQVPDVVPHEFYYTRGIYTGGGRRWGGYGRSWTIDYPKSDRQFLLGVKRLLDIDAYGMEHAVALDDPELNRFPFLYMVEVGQTAMTESEIAGLRRYLQAGGFLVVDDFWGSYEWEVWESQITRVFPEYHIVDIPIDHPLMNTVYPIKEILQVPNVGNAHRGVTSEQDGYVPHCRGIFDDQGRLLVVINWNTDLGDAWEWAEDPYYPLKYSTFAWEMGINFIVYSMSH
ncbi:MAG: DUF4159 domain-containing protein [Gemmatimonadetes bacterium]|nr:DUF4159 domain-containing protein [Gemmatimonadota bacterium]